MGAKMSDRENTKLSPFWSNILENAFPTYFCTFLVGIFVSTVINLFTTLILIDKIPPVCEMITLVFSIIFFFTASICLTFLAWIFESAHSQWVNEGSPDEYSHKIKIVNRVQKKITMLLVATFASIIIGLILLCVVIIMRY
jgi:hypothetical protein